MSPLGRSSSISAVNGSRPAGPAADVLTSQAAPSDPTMASNAISVFISVMARAGRCRTVPLRITCARR